LKLQASGVEGLDPNPNPETTKFSGNYKKREKP